MSQSLFGLRKQPFAALPDVDCFVPLEGICQAFDELLQAATEGRGIGVLTAPAGLGKTLVCQRLARELSANFRVAFLPTGNFLTRRSLLQAILFELGHSFVRMGDQELRLALSATLRAIRPAHRGLVLIVDEAHLLAARMLEEVRALLSFGEAGEPLVRLIVSGQLSLEETLSHPQCDAFNQRIACQVMLPSFSREESSSYLVRRLAWAGANISEVFAREAVAAICEAADGVPRCLHQLADHCLTIGANRAEKPISLRIVREALDHLKQLPLNWAEPTIGRATTNPLEAARAEAVAMAEASIELDGPMARNPNPSPKSSRESLSRAVFDTYPLQTESLESDDVLELQTASNTWDLDASSELVAPWADEDGADEEADQRFDEDVVRHSFSSNVIPEHAEASADLDFGDVVEVESVVDIEANDTLHDIGASALNKTESESRRITLLQQSRDQQPCRNETVDATVLPEIELPQTATTAVMDEEVVVDRYAALDSALNRLTRTMLNVRANARRKAAESIAQPLLPSPPPIPTEILDGIHQQFDVVLPEETVANEPSRVKSGANSSIHAAEPLSANMAVLETVAAPVTLSSAVSAASPVATAPTVREATSRTTTDERRPYQLLFSELRRRRRRV
ncbi:MAG TPA: AAA family ATPase [Planctomycetaceae bacterium]|nr:AAA family ATPase [Planctomycetaceae bacterium]